MRLRVIAFAVAALLFLAILTLGLASAFSRKPTSLGVVSYRLYPCPNRPNCVSSQYAPPDHAVEPLHYTGTPAPRALAAARDALASLPGAKVVETTPVYVRAEVTSSVFRFVDDVELLLSTRPGVVEVRSASRVGRSDFGVNRRRVEALRKAFSARLPSAAPPR